MSRMLKALVAWRNLLLPILVILLADVILTFVFGSHIRSQVQFVFGNNNKDTFVALMFLEGAAILGIGAYVASGHSEVKIIRKDSPAATAYLAEKLFEQRKEYREEQVSEGLILMLVGAILLAAAFLIYIVL